MFGGFERSIYGEKGSIRDFQVFDLGVSETCELAEGYMREQLPCDLSWPPLGSFDQNLQVGRNVLRGCPVNDGANSGR